MVGRRKQNGFAQCERESRDAAREISQDQHHSDLGRKRGGNRCVEGNIVRKDTTVVRDITYPIKGGQARNLWRDWPRLWAGGS